MMTPKQYNDAMDLASKVKRAGFELEVSGNRFCMMPKTGFAALLYPTDDKMFLDSVSDVLAFVHGWHAFAKALEGTTGIDTDEVKSRIEQQKVADVLAGKRRRTRSLVR